MYVEQDELDKFPMHSAEQQIADGNRSREETQACLESRLPAARKDAVSVENNLGYYGIATWQPLNSKDIYNLKDRMES